MTGYGRGVADREGWRAVVEIRAVNHRFLDLKVRGTSLEPAIQQSLEKSVRAVCKRGSVTVSIKLERRGARATMSVDLAAAARVHDDLARLAGHLGLSGSVNLELVCQQPGVIVALDDAADGEVVAGCVATAVQQALDTLTRMRETEGASLESEVRERLARIGALSQRIGDESESAPRALQARLGERVARLLESRGTELSPERLAQETALLADRVDITEELVRLRSHVEHMQALMDEARAQKGPVGRRLDFLVQEMSREINTIGSKSQSSTIPHAVVETKAQLEKIREQVQNIE